MSRYLLIVLGFLTLIPLTSHGAEVACTLEYMPVCGQPPMPVCPVGMACIQVMPPPKTYGNICMMRADGATLIHEGDCNISQTTPPVACTKEYAPVCGMVEVQCVMAPCYPVRTDFGNLCMAKSAGATDITDGTCEMSESPVMDPPALPVIWTPSDYVSLAHQNKITRYSELSDFRYEHILTRQEAAALITRYLIESRGRSEAVCKLAYQDMNLIDTTLTPSVSHACGMGVMYGHDGYFHPRYSLTRGEALAVLIRALDQKKLDESMTPWYKGYMDRAFDLGLGFTNMKVYDEVITRGQFIEWLYTLQKNIPTPDSNLLGEWKLELFSTGEDLPEISTGGTLVFTSDRYSLRLCNTIGATYTTKNGIFTTGPAMSTMMACADTALTRAESFWDLSGASYSIQSTRGDSKVWLTIRLARGGEYRFVR